MWQVESGLTARCSIVAGAGLLEEQPCACVRRVRQCLESNEEIARLVSVTAEARRAEAEAKSQECEELTHSSTTCTACAPCPDCSCSCPPQPTCFMGISSTEPDHRHPREVGPIQPAPEAAAPFDPENPGEGWTVVEVSE